ncbi:hypothetical protein JOQ06_027586 [Pogonophryne albipinna]|uniref:Copine C-terminal domain-containing protein n=1 Tax=Pogonophryne albipinna TaxID=1090488 RepID=A0AAD6BEC3_9TELE|nr:hypothetical protein JOQ06_027586 [Pogonophryne albipinna]
MELLMSVSQRRTQLNFTVAIDFTASNGNPSQPTSLHYMSPYQINAYAMALKAVGEIIQDYDSDKLFPAYGFGAKLPPDGKISHAFPLKTEAISLAIDSSCDRTDMEQLSVFVRFFDGKIFREKLLCLLTLPGRTTGEIIFHELTQFFEKNGLNKTNMAPQMAALVYIGSKTDLTTTSALKLVRSVMFKIPLRSKESDQANSNAENPNCVAIEGVLEAYFQSLRTVQLYGPTNFAPVISQVARCAAEVTDGSQFFVLLMITDGVISDMDQTKEAVVNAAGLPMSIIIVGVGPAEFDAMEELDGDEVRVSSRGRSAERDIVQFVPLRDYMDRSGNSVLSMARLAKDVLAEIPEQLLSFMKSRGLEPRPPLPAASDPPSMSTSTPAPKQSKAHA